MTRRVWQARTTFVFVLAPFVGGLLAITASAQLPSPACGASCTARGIGAAKSGTASGTVSCMQRCSPSVPFAMTKATPDGRYVALFSDTTVLKEHERKLERTAHYDALTGLPNRVLLADHLHQGMVQTEGEHAHRRGDRPRRRLPPPDHRPGRGTCGSGRDAVATRMRARSGFFHRAPIPADVIPAWVPPGIPIRPGSGDRRRVATTCR